MCRRARSSVHAGLVCGRLARSQWAPPAQPQAAPAEAMVAPTAKATALAAEARLALVEEAPRDVLPVRKAKLPDGVAVISACDLCQFLGVPR